MITANGSNPAVLIFGAYGGIGSALARRLHAAGVPLVLSGRDESRLNDLAVELGALALAADASDFAAVDHVVARAVDHTGALRGVVNCAGSLLLKPAHMTKPEEFRATIDASLTSAFAILRASARPMTRSGGGSIVFVSTAAASHGLPNHEAIAAAKGGVDALVRSAAATYGKGGIRVNAVAPGLVETPLTARITGSETARAASESMHVLGRLGTPEDVAGAIQWILSDEAAWVTGQVLGVDGGLGSVRSA
jgi:NAD(P)-dependent dehydrogenase (short-subunit alcohol dehydrogenase family)